jgi:hypothetical protein
MNWHGNNNSNFLNQNDQNKQENYQNKNDSESSFISSLEDSDN